MAMKSDVEGNLSTMIDHSKLLDLTSYNGSTVTVGSTAWVKRGIKDVTAGYQKNPDASPALAKTIMQMDGGVIHSGGAFWSAADADYQSIRKWIAEGARDN